MDDERDGHQRKGCMLVLSRKKNEAILIDGVIRVEVVTVSKAAVRVRLMAPRSLRLPHGIARTDIPGHDENTARTSPVGVEVSHLTLVNQQIVTLGESISLGVVDADKARALFFVDTPLGMSVTAVTPQEPDPRTRSSRQNLLQFMGPAADWPPEDRDRIAQPVVHPDPENRSPSVEPGPELLPFPSPEHHRQRM